MTMRNNDIAVTYVKFVDKHNGKTRPIVIIDQNERDYIAFKLTTQFAHKSAKIQANYYEMKEWHFSGLEKKLGLIQALLWQLVSRIILK